MLILTVVFFSAVNPYFGTFENYTNIGAGSASLGVMAVGVALALATGAIDFSIAGNAALTGVVAALVTQRVGSSWAIPAGMAVATAIGIVNGTAVTRFGVNPFIATLAIAGSLRGVGFVLAGSQGILVDSGPLVSLGQGKTQGLPNSLLALLCVVMVGFIVLRYSQYGRMLLAVGGNSQAARLAGIRSTLVLFSGYILSAIAAGFAGLLLAGRTGVANPLAASGNELLVFSAVILGGTGLWGGRASIIGSLLGILLLNSLYVGLVLSDVSPYWQTPLQGALLIFAVWLMAVRTRKNDPDENSLVRLARLLRRGSKE
ncbi:MAG: ABC transporter permease [Candidatus Dormibacteraceae bacterium]